MPAERDNRSDGPQGHKGSPEGFPALRAGLLAVVLVTGILLLTGLLLPGRSRRVEEARLEPLGRASAANFLLTDFLLTDFLICRRRVADVLALTGEGSYPTNIPTFTGWTTDDRPAERMLIS